MKLLNFALGGTASFGAVKDGGIVDLKARLRSSANDLIGLIAAEDISRMVKLQLLAAPPSGTTTPRSAAPLAS